MTDFATLRRRMVDNEIRTRGVTNRDVLAAFLAVPREVFVEADERAFAYADCDVAMSRDAPGRRMGAAAPVARLIQELPLDAEAKVLVVGAGTGYSAAILSRLAGAIVAVEENEALAARAPAALREAGAGRVKVVRGTLTAGHAADGPYNAILVDGAAETMPGALLGQLKPGGALAVVEQNERVSRAVRYERVGEEFSKWPLFEGWAPLLPGFERVSEFVF